MLYPGWQLLSLPVVPAGPWVQHQYVVQIRLAHPKTSLSASAIGNWYPQEVQPVARKFLSYCIGEVNCLAVGLLTTCQVRKKD